MPEIMSDTHVDRTDVPDTSEPDQLVVDLPQLDLVTGRLAQLNIHPSQPPVVDEALGLALLRLPPGSDVHGLTLQLRSADHAVSPVIGTNPHVGTVYGAVVPYPETKPHMPPYVLASGVLPAPTDEARSAPGVHVGVLDIRFDDAAPASLLDGHTAFVHSLILDQAPQATVTVRSVLVPDIHATAWDVAQALMALADAGVHVINLSVGCRTPDGEPPLLLRRAVELLRARVVLVAAGSPGQTTWPAALPGVVAVGARNADDSVADASPELPWVTCTAPASLVVDLTATVPLCDGKTLNFKGYPSWSGTAFAAATVSGAIAAHTVLGQVTAQDALAGLLAGDGGVVRKYVPGDDGQRA